MANNAGFSNFTSRAFFLRWFGLQDTTAETLLQAEYVPVFRHGRALDKDESIDIEQVRVPLRL